MIVLALILKCLSPQCHWFVYFAQGCPEVPQNFTGTWRAWLGNGTLVTEENYLDGQLDGPATYWNTDGTVNVTTAYRQGRLHGPWRRLYSNGTVHRDFSYLDGQRVGRWVEFYPDGTRYSESFYARPSVLDGAQLKWTTNRETKVLRVWRDGMPWDGKFYSTSNGNEILRLYTNGALIEERDLGPIRPIGLPAAPKTKR